jgi:hypothetical protein
MSGAACSRRDTKLNGTKRPARDAATMRCFGLFLLTAVVIAAIGFGARNTGLAEAISLSPYACGDGRGASPFSGLTLLLFVIVMPLSVVLGRKVFFRKDYPKPIATPESRHLVGFIAVSTALFLILAALVTYLLQYFATPCADRYLDVPMLGHRIIFIAILFSVIGVLFSDLLRYRFGPARNP